MTTGSETLDRIVERLRSRKENVYDYASQGAEWQDDKLCGEAADEIERLMYELEASAKLELAEKIRADNLEVELAECRAERDRMREAGKAVTKWWYSLPGGAKYSSRRIEKWLNARECYDAFVALRAALTREGE
jgi:hypothetical protein